MRGVSRESSHSTLENLLKSAIEGAVREQGIEQLALRTAAGHLRILFHSPARLVRHAERLVQLRVERPHASTIVVALLALRAYKEPTHI